MSFIEKENPVVVNIKLTTDGRKKLASGKFNVTKFSVGDSEMNYSYYNNINYNKSNSLVLKPKDNIKDIRYKIKKYFNDENFLYNITPLSSKRETKIDLEMGFFENENLFKINTSLAKINNIFIDYSDINITTLRHVSIKQNNFFTFITEPEIGDYLMVNWENIYNTDLLENYIIDKDKYSPFLWYKIINIDGSIQNNTLTVEVDRDLPNFTVLQPNNIMANCLIYPKYNSITEFYGSQNLSDFWNFTDDDYIENTYQNIQITPILNLNIIYPDNNIGFNLNSIYPNNLQSYKYMGFLKHINEYRKKNNKIYGIVHYTNTTPHNILGESLYKNTTEIILPSIMWYRNDKEQMGLYLKCGKSLKIIEDHNIFYYDLVDKTGFVVGKCFNELKIILIEDQEILTALSFKSNRNWTYPPFKTFLNDFKCPVEIVEECFDPDYDDNGFIFTMVGDDFNINFNGNLLELQNNFDLYVKFSLKVTLNNYNDHVYLEGEVVEIINSDQPNISIDRTYQTPVLLDNILNENNWENHLTIETELIEVSCEEITIPDPINPVQVPSSMFSDIIWHNIQNEIPFIDSNIEIRVNNNIVVNETNSNNGSFNVIENDVVDILITYNGNIPIIDAVDPKLNLTVTGGILNFDDTVDLVSGISNQISFSFTVVGDNEYTINSLTTGESIPDCEGGVPDMDFLNGIGDGYNDRVMNILIDGDQLINVGWFTEYNGIIYNRISKINKNNGDINPIFIGSTNDRVRPIALDGNDVFIGGNFTQYNSQNALYIAKLNKNTGIKDSVFSGGFQGVTTIESIIVDISSNSIYVGGSFSNYNGVNKNGVVKIDKNSGVLDSSFTYPITTYVRGLAVNGNDLYVVSSNGFINKVNKFTGQIDPDFNFEIPSTDARDVIIGSDNSLYVSHRPISQTNWYVSKCSLVSGSVINSFTDNGNRYFNNMPIKIEEYNNSIVVCGVFTQFNNINYSGIVRINKQTGEPDPDFNIGINVINDGVLGFKTEPNRYYICGDFTEYRGEQANKICKIIVCD